MLKICFICLGNICRSPMAELILRQKLRDNNIKNVLVESRGTSYEEQGNPIYPKAQDTLANHNIELSPHRATCLEKEDLRKFDYFICMEDYHVEVSRRILGPKANIIKLLDYDIEDPWYTNNFEKVYQEIDEGCNIIIKKIKERKIYDVNPK